MESDQHCIVYPAPEPIKAPLPSGQIQGNNTVPQKGQQGDFYGLREYRNGDEVRKVDWKSTAKHSRLIVKELEKETRKQVELIVNNAQNPKTDFGEDSELETAITIAASLAKDFIFKNYSVAIASRGTSVSWGSGTEHLFAIYKALALLNAEPHEVEVRGDLATDVYKILCKGSPASKSIYHQANSTIDQC